jgi:hypothetical protein
MAGSARIGVAVKVCVVSPYRYRVRALAARAFHTALYSLMKRIRRRNPGLALTLASVNANATTTRIINNRVLNYPPTLHPPSVCPAPHLAATSPASGVRTLLPDVQFRRHPRMARRPASLANPASPVPKTRPQSITTNTTTQATLTAPAYAYEYEPSLAAAERELGTMVPNWGSSVQGKQRLVERGLCGGEGCLGRQRNNAKANQARSTASAGPAADKSRCILRNPPPRQHRPVQLVYQRACSPSRPLLIQYRLKRLIRTIPDV